MGAKPAQREKDPVRQERGRARKEADIAAGLVSPDGLRYIFAGNVDAAIYVVAGRPRGVASGLTIVKTGKAKMTSLKRRLATHRRNGLSDVLLVLPYPADGARDVDLDELLAVRTVHGLPGAVPLTKANRTLLGDGYREAALIPAPDAVGVAVAVAASLQGVTPYSDRNDV